MYAQPMTFPLTGSARGSRSVLVVDDEPTMRAALTESLRRNGYGADSVADGREALDRLGEQRPWLVLTDLRMPHLGGLDVLREIKRRSPRTAVVVMTAYGTVETAVEAMKQGASDVLLKPFAAEALERILAGLEAADPAPAGGEGARPLLGEDPAMARALGAAETVAASAVTVLLSGESGTGKELLARFIHARSPRARGPFVAVNCAALPDGLLESELFGHERGAFTGALGRKAGKFELAHGGTILLDEISEMNIGLQAKLLRVLQERTVDRVGGREPVRVDIRVIATTNRSLRREVEEGRFREDLYYRLNVFPIALPPLRERPADIPVLARHFVAACAARNGLPLPVLTEAALLDLASRPWRGNVRELENAMERAVLLAGGGPIGPEHLPGEGASVGAAPAASPAAPAPPAGPSLWEMERALIVRTLEDLKGNRTHAAKRLGISVRTLRNKLREYRQLAAAAETAAARPSEGGR
jgi:two-component system response regulator FlrC